MRNNNRSFKSKTTVNDKSKPYIRIKRCSVCGQDVIRKQITKEGKSKGHFFYNCKNAHKSENKACNKAEFVFEDQVLRRHGLRNYQEYVAQCRKEEGEDDDMQEEYEDDEEE